jgi:hypothetical protein
MVAIGAEQVELQLRGFYAELGNGCEEIEELFIAGQEAHQNTLVVGWRREDSPPHRVGKMAPFLTGPVLGADSL